jgi:(3,5-dihydroxyphenyl)acetyl-CoA 1,2-dioxygenase
VGVAKNPADNGLWEVIVQKVAVRSASSSLSTPAFGASLAYNAEAAGKYLGEVERQLQAHRANGADQQRPEVAALKAGARRVKERFFRLHAAAIYDEVTDKGARFLRITEVVEAAAARYPALLPSRAQLEAERALKKQSAKEGRELDQGLFLGQVLADKQRGMHLIHAMLRPKREALDRLAEFQRTGSIDLGLAKVERKGKVGHVTHSNTKFLNAEDNLATAALETAVDLVLLDETIEVGVLRGGVVQHPKHAGRRVFNAGINLTHLYYGQIAFVDFLMERELGLLHKMYRGHWLSDSYEEEYEDYVEKPWIAAVESFAIGGGCQLLCIMDRVLAEPGSYFNLPASKEGFIPGGANLRLPRLVGVKLTRDGLFFERKFEADTPEGRLICDEVVPAGEMDAAIERNAQQLVKAGMTSLVANRKALRVGQEPLSDFRRYYATYARQQSLCMYDAKLLENLESSWKPAIRTL